jgi:hypothetical protein
MVRPIRFGERETYRRLTLWTRAKGNERRRQTAFRHRMNLAPISVGGIAQTFQSARPLHLWYASVTSRNNSSSYRAQKFIRQSHPFDGHVELNRASVGIFCRRHQIQTMCSVTRVFLCLSFVNCATITPERFYSPRQSAAHCLDASGQKGPAGMERGQYQASGPLVQSSGRLPELLRANKATGGDRTKKLFQFLNIIGTRALS